MRFGTRLIQQAEDLARYTQDDSRLTRTYLTPQHRQAGDYLLALMRDAGMQADYDALGNVVGRYAGLTPDAPVIMSGSHLDSVVDAGKYDGLFGILTAIACVHDLNARAVRLPHAIEVVAFCDEEGVRFNVTMVGSAAMSGHFDPAWLEMADDAGLSMREAIGRFGGYADGWATLQRDFGRVACFVESHIEQGPVLLDAGLPVGVVTAIAGCTRIKVGVTGLAGHAGTVPMAGRCDALAAAAEMAPVVEQPAQARTPYCRHGRQASVAGGGAVNVIPGQVEFSIGPALRRRRAAPGCTPGVARQPRRHCAAPPRGIHLGALLRAHRVAMRTVAAKTHGRRHRRAWRERQTFAQRGGP